MSLDAKIVHAGLRTYVKINGKDAVEMPDLDTAMLVQNLLVHAYGQGVKDIRAAFNYLLTDTAK